MVGACAISAVPLFSGFVSKAMVVSAAAEAHRAGIFLTLTLASAGTFLHTGLKLPYYMFFGDRRAKAEAHEPPANMLLAMSLTAVACVVIGVFPGLLYSALPYSVEYAPYTVRHVTATLGLLAFTALGFFSMLRYLDPEAIVSLDTDWFYRKGAGGVLALSRGVLARAESAVGEIYDGVVRWGVLAVAGRLREIDLRGLDAIVDGVGRVTQAVSRSLSLTVTGHAQHYGLIMAAGVLVAIALVFFSR
jgi:multicomponent Na+:H+ antiporter subunit D